MAVAAILAAALTDHSARAFALTVGGVDVIKDPAQRYGVPIGSIQVTEAGPGGVSSMMFTIEDYQLAVTMFTGLPVIYTDLTRDVINFAGWVQNYRARPDFGQQGRSIDVICTGADALLDWACSTGDVTYAAGTKTATVVQAFASNCTGIGPLRTGGADLTALPLGNGTQALPVAPLLGYISGFPSGGGTILLNALTIPAGTTLREGIRLISADRFTGASDAFTQTSSGQSNVTVDYTYGLRVWDVPPPGIDPVAPDDYGTEVLVNTAAGNHTEGIELGVDDQLIRGVFVVGAGGAQAYVSDAGLWSGVRQGDTGQISLLTDTSLTTVAQCQAAGASYLFGAIPAVRASYNHEDKAPPSGVHAGSVITLTDSKLGISAKVFTVYDITKTFNDSGRENWRMSFGGRPPSLTAQIRRLTRTQRN